jgi:Carboxypeptidase regulatory-like domain
MTRTRHLAVLVLVAAFTAIGIAQIATTSLRGVVRDPSGAVVPGASVTLTNGANGQQLSVTSDAAGSYIFPQLPPASYTIQVTATGFGSQSKFAQLLVNQPATIDFTLTVQASNTVVNVSAIAQTLNTTDASLGNAMGNSEIQALPSLTRNVPDLLSLQPGVLYLPPPPILAGQDSRSGAVNGGRSDQGNITIDGIDDNDQVGGFAFTGVLRETQDSIEEFRTVTSNANADAGRSSGAQVSQITKSGTNRFHGALYEYHRPTFTVANDWFNKQAELSSKLPNIPGKLIRNIFGGDLGGPIFKNKLFFFGNYEGQRQAENAQVSETDPTASYQKGNLIYQGDTAGGGLANVTLSPAQVTALDTAAGCAVCNTPAYTPGPGPNPYALAYFNSQPAANGTFLGDGLNTGSYSFSSPNPVTLNTGIARIDWSPSDKHRVFVRGGLQKDTRGDPEQYPGQGPSNLHSDNTKGIVAGWTWTLSPTLVNDLRYGYIRQGFSDRGVGSGDYVTFRFQSTITAQTRTTINSVPVNNIVDNFNWSKGNHNIQLGVNWRLVHQNHSSDADTFTGASSNPYGLGGSPPDPSTLGLDPVDSGFGNSYVIAYANLVGTVPEVDQSINYKVSSPTTGTLLPDGAFVDRHFSANEYEYYIQDSWRVTPKLTLTYGLRHTLLQTPWETKGQQVSPTIDTDAWYKKRESEALQGNIYEPNLYFAPSGKFYHKPGFWPKSKNNIAPRFAIAYAPDAKTSIRAGFGIYYDHYGEGLINTYDQAGSFGLNSTITNPLGELTTVTAPRFTGEHNIPFLNVTPPPTQTFPYPAPFFGFADTWGLNNKLKTPYSESFDFSVQRELPHGFTVEVAYVGRLGRHLLQAQDLTEPVNFVDPMGGGDYYRAGSQLSRLVDVHGGNGNATVQPIKYFEDVFPYMANLDYLGESATQSIYTNEWSVYRSDLGATTALADIDFFCSGVNPATGQFRSYPCPANFQSRFWQNQFAALYVLNTIGSSSYNAGQFSIRHESSHGLQLDASYTLSKTLDWGSDAERSTEIGASGSAFSESQIINTWKPYLNNSVADFDTLQLFTADAVYQLPFGRGKALAGDVNGFVNGFIGGWQLSGIARVTSGLPFTLSEPGFTTDWQQPGFGVAVGNVKTHTHFDSQGNPQVFADNTANAINSGLSTGSPMRFSYPGEAGERNKFRGNGYFEIDTGLTKSWPISHYGALKFDWEIYNVTNTVRFDPESINPELTQPTLGDYSATLSQPRKMQFALRYDF